MDFEVQEQLLEEMIADLPADAEVEDVCIGPFDTLVKSAGWGLSSTFRDPCSGHAPAWIRGAGELVGKSARELARLALSPRLLEASLGMAALNSLLADNGRGHPEVNAARIVAERARGKNLVVVGDFPFLKKLEGEVGSLTVISRPPGEGADGVREAAGPLSRADVAAISGSAFINRTAAALLALCPRAYTVVLGPTAPFSPVLFRRGVDVVCGSWVEDAARVRACVSQGASFRQIRGLKLVAWFKPESDRG